MPKVDQGVVMAPEQLGQDFRAGELTRPKGEHDRYATPEQRRRALEDLTFVALDVEPEQRDGVGVDDAVPGQAVERYGLDADEVGSLTRVVSEPAGADAVLPSAPPFPGEARLAGTRGCRGRDDLDLVADLAQRKRRPQHLAVLGIRLDCDAALESMDDQRRHDSRADVCPGVADRPAPSL